MSPIEDCPCWRSQGFTLLRREFFQKMAAAALSCVVVPLSLRNRPLKNRPSPKFWFGDSVDFRWNDEKTGESHFETGVVVGAAWIHYSDEWQYVVTWLASTIDPDGNYPIFSEELVPEAVLCKP